MSAAMYTSRLGAVAQLLVRNDYSPLNPTPAVQRQKALLGGPAAAAAAADGAEEEDGALQTSAGVTVMLPRMKVKICIAHAARVRSAPGMRSV